MREILFRGRMQNGRWIYGNLNFYPDINRTFIRLHPEENDIKNTLETEVKKETIGQYIGLIDKNGKKIFEGDILESHYDEGCPEDVCYEVVLWYDNSWCIQEGCAKPDHLTEDDVLKYSEVVGNIYDNPELLKGVGENE